MADYEIVEKLAKAERQTMQIVAGYIPPHQVEKLLTEAAATIVELAEALVVAESLLAQVPYEFETTNGGRIPVTKASEARDRARSALSRLKGTNNAG